VTNVWVDAGFKDDVAIHGAVPGIDVEHVKRYDTATGFVPRGDGESSSRRSCTVGVVIHGGTSGIGLGGVAATLSNVDSVRPL
jgi:hypothetical protein